MSDQENEVTQHDETTPAPQPEAAPEAAAESSAAVAAEAAPGPVETPEAPAAEAPAAPPKPQGGENRRQQQPRGEGQRKERGERPQGPRDQQRGDRPPREGRPGGERQGGDRPGGRGDRPQQGRGPDRGRDRRPEPPAEIDIEKLIADSLYLDNQAHAIVSRMRDMDSGTRSQLRRLYSAIRRACRAVETDRQHQFVMLRARLAYTIARHQLRSLDTLEKLLLQVTRKNDPRGYERFRDLFEAIVAYNE